MTFRLACSLCATSTLAVGLDLYTPDQSGFNLFLWPLLGLIFLPLMRLISALI
jgi:hypothetical protein